MKIGRTEMPGEYALCYGHTCIVHCFVITLHNIFQPTHATECSQHKRYEWQILVTIFCREVFDVTLVKYGTFFAEWIRMNLSVDYGQMRIHLFGRNSENTEVLVIMNSLQNSCLRKYSPFRYLHSVSMRCNRTENGSLLVLYLTPENFNAVNAVENQSKAISNFKKTMWCDPDHPTVAHRYARVHNMRMIASSPYEMTTNETWLVDI